MDQDRSAQGGESALRSPEEGLPGQAQTACVAVARQLIARYRWSLLSVEELAARTYAAAAALPSAVATERVAYDQYARALYAACRQADDPLLRERAYTDLRHYLFCAAYQRRPGQAEDLAHEALLLVIEQIGRVREPGAFQKFALFKLLHVLKETPDEALSALPAEAAQAEAAGPDELAVDGERSAALFAAIARLPDPEQRQAVLLKYLGGLKDEQIAGRLQITANAVRVLRHRSMNKLRGDPQLRAVISPPDLPLGS